jgi:hypothetical protein
MTYTATEVNHETKCWIVKRWKGEAAYPQHFTNADYDGAEIWGADTEEQAIEMAKKRGSWA